MFELNTKNLFCTFDFLLGRWKLVIHLQFHTHFVHALWSIGVAIDIVFRGFTSEFCADVVQVSERHSGQYMRLKVVDNPVKNVRRHLDVFAVKTSL